MKQTFSHKTLDWIIIGISLLFSVLTFINLTNGFEYFSSYILRLTFALVSLTAFISMFFQKVNGERFSRIFLIVVLVIPGIMILYQFLTDLIFYGVNRMNLLQNPTLFPKLLGGIALLYFAIKYSNQQKAERIKDYGILIVGIGIFTICYALTRAIEPIVNLELIDYPIWKTTAKSIIGILTLIIGIKIKKQKLQFNKGLIMTSILMFIFGLI